MPVKIDKDTIKQAVLDLKTKKHVVQFKDLDFEGIFVRDVPCIPDTHNQEEVLVSAKTLSALCKLVAKVRKENAGDTTVEYSD